MSINMKIKIVLGVVCKLSGHAELPVRTDYELRRTLQCLFSKTEAKK